MDIIRRLWNMPDRRADAYILSGLAIIAFALYANTLNNGFVYDDQLLIVSNTRLRDWSYISTAFTHSFSYDVPFLNHSNMPIDYYRPFIRMFFGLSYQAFELNAPYWHLLNVLIYCGTAALSYSLIKRIGAGAGAAAAGALLFAAHPIHSEAAAWTCGTVDTLHALFFFGSFILYLCMQDEKTQSKRRVFFLGSIALFMAALLTKEMALSLPILIAVHRFIFNESGEQQTVNGMEEKAFTPFDFRLSSFISAVRASVPYFLTIAVYMLIRYLSYGGVLRVGSKLPLKITLLTIPSVIVEYLRMFVWPLGLSTIHKVPLALEISSVKFWLPLAALIAAGAIILLRASRPMLFACAWILVTMLPVLNIGAFVPEMMMQDRYAFVPSLGFCAAVAIAMESMIKREGLIARLRPVLTAGFIAVAIFFAALAFMQNGYWRSDETLFARSVKQNPDSERANCDYGWALLDAGKGDDAARSFSVSFNMRNGRSKCACMGLGKYYADKKDYDQSVIFYERALDLKAGRDNLLIFTNLASAYKENGQIGKAITVLDKALEEYPDFTEARYMLNTLVGSNPPDVLEKN